MANLGALAVYLTADTSQFRHGMGRAKKSVSKFRIAATVAFAAVAAAAVKGMASSVKAYATQEKAERKLQATLRSTGYAAGFTSKQLGKFASEMQKNINIGDEVILEHMGILATFKQINGETFKEAIMLAEDLAVRMGTDARSAIIQVGKALNDPKKGLDGLSRAGIQFSDQQKDQIKTLQTSGNLLGAQALVLEELKTQFKGAAKAAADAEPWVKFGDTMGDIQEQVGGITVEALAIASGFSDAQTAADSFLTLLTDNARGISSFISSMAIELKFGFKSGMRAGEIFFDNALMGVIQLMDAIKQLATNFSDLFSDPKKFFKSGQWKQVLDVELTSALKPRSYRDELAKLEGEKASALAAAVTSSFNKINAEQKKDIKELKEAAKAVKENAKPKPVVDAKGKMGGAEMSLAGAFALGSTQAYSIIAQAEASSSRNFQERSLQALEAIEAATRETVESMRDIASNELFGMTGGIA